jgi:hypothetical protein
MKMVIVATFVGIMTAGAAFGEEPAKVIVLPAKPGNVTFEHQKHIKMKNSCAPCHATEQGGKIEGFGKDMAHTVCKGCHTDQKAGPTVCKGCHHD